MILKLALVWLLNALALIAVAYLVPGVAVSSFGAALVAALVLGLVNAVVRPVLVLLTLPVTVLTLGLFIFPMVCIPIYFAFTTEEDVRVWGPRFSRWWKNAAAPLAPLWSRAARIPHLPLPESMRIPSSVVFTVCALAVAFLGIEAERWIERNVRKLKREAKRS